MVGPNIFIIMGESFFSYVEKKVLLYCFYCIVHFNRPKKIFELLSAVVDSA
jgi:hypothetical protein